MMTGSSWSICCDDGKSSEVGRPLCSTCQMKCVSFRDFGDSDLEGERLLGTFRHDVWSS